MTHKTDSHSLFISVLTCAMVAACGTSVYTALFAVLMLLLMLLIQRLVNALASTALPKNMASVVAVTIAGGAVTQLLAIVSVDLQTAFIPIIVFACIASSVQFSMRAAPQQLAQTLSAQHLLLLILTGAVVELLAWGTLPVDREFAFGGALRALELRITDKALLPWLASPAGALAILASLLALFARKPATTANQNHAITSPHPGRRVRVTGHIR